MEKILEYVEALPDRLKVISCLVINLLLGIADYVTGDFSLSVFYLIPIVLASWFIGKKACFFMSMVCCAELFVFDMLLATEYVDVISARSWEVLMEMCFLLLTGHLLSKVRSEIEKTRQKSIELEVANKELEAANKELAAFNYTVAHDLRQPLNLVNGYCQVIDKLCGDQLQEDCKNYLTEAYNNTLRMNSLIDALLNFSRMGHVEPHREMVDLSLMAQEVAKMLKLIRPERQVDFRIADGIVVNGETSLLRVALDNLLGNAWKYTGVREQAVIEFGVRDINGVPTYFVRDNGVGFDMTYADKLFTPFLRLPGAEKYRGFGIGLATVERIILRHGGKLWAEGEPGKGACIYFTLSAP